MNIVIYFIIYYLILIFYANNLNIANFEINYLNSNYFMNYFSDIAFYLFGKNNFTLRLPSLIFSFFSLLLFYRISLFYIKNKKYAFISTIIFSLLPGFIVASLLYDKAIFIIFLTLLFLYTFIFYRVYSYFLLISYALIDYSFISLYFSLIFYSIYIKNNKFLIFNLFLLMINANYFSYDIHGHPSGHFIDLFLVYLSIFSPLIFLYFIYSLLKLNKYEKLNIIWFISLFSFILSLILSFRQKIRIDDYASFVIIYSIFMLKVFIYDYKIRLSIFRFPYKILSISLIISLIIFDVFLFFSPYILDRYIVNQFKYSKSIALILKRNHIDYIKCNDYVLCKKLYFYGIKKGDKYYLLFDYKNKKVSILHNKNELFKEDVLNINKK